MWMFGQGRPLRCGKKWLLWGREERGGGEERKGEGRGGDGRGGTRSNEVKGLKIRRGQLISVTMMATEVVALLRLVKLLP